MNYCPLCEREDDTLLLERHHLKTKRIDKKDTELICKECHKTIHGLFTQTDLRSSSLQLNSIEGLIENEIFSKAISHIKKIIPGSFMKMKQSKHKKINDKYKT